MSQPTTAPDQLSPPTPRPPARPPWLKRGLSAATVLVLLYLVASALVFRMALVPHRKVARSSPDKDGVVAESIHFDSAQGGPNLNGWYVPSDGDRAIVVLHGLDSQSWNRYSRQLTEALHAHHFTVLLFDFRGQGKSEGDKLGLGWLERQDVRAAVDVLLSRGFKAGQIGLNGTSYGAATALLSAAMIPEVGAVVADSPFADMRDLMRSELKSRVGVSGFFIPGVTLMGRLWTGLDMAEIAPIHALPQLAPRPILFMHGTGDTRIPSEHSERLKAASMGDQDELWLVPGAEHCKEYEVAPDEYFSRVLGFFEKHLPTQKPLEPLPIPPRATEPGPVTMPSSQKAAANETPAAHP